MTNRYYVSARVEGVAIVSSSALIVYEFAPSGARRVRRRNLFRGLIIVSTLFIVVYAFSIGFKNAGVFSSTTIDKEVAINILSDTATVSGVLAGFSMLLMGDNLSSMMRARIDPQRQILRFRENLRDREALLIVDAIYLSGFFFTAFDAIYTLPATTNGALGDTVYGPLLTLLAVFATLLLRIGFSFLLSHERSET